MKSILADTKKLYLEIDEHYQQKEFEAKNRGWEKRAARIAQLRILNDHAYFLFLFSRFEDHVRSESKKLITKMQSGATGRHNKRAWEFVSRKNLDEQLTLKNRVALLIDKGSADFRLISEYYDIRNEVAHGGSFSGPLLISRVIVDLERLHKKLKA